ncbi:MULTISPECIES: hypothetical protein [unclassified Niallia]|uniref:hypothetical protein n=1 Tax=unclassified Niallia TaxID=2837522 RepID=UPI0030F59D52
MDSKNSKMIDNAKKLANEIVRIENQIQLIIESKQYVFDVLYDGELGWIVQTSYCQIGGCIVNYIPCKSKISAIEVSARLTFKGVKPDAYGSCLTCSEDIYEMQT